MELNKENILHATAGGLEVFEYFLTDFPGINKAFLNPFYKDTKASCYVFRDPGTSLCRFVDFGNSQYNGDCFSIVGHVFGKDCQVKEEFLWILAVINTELGLGLNQKGLSSKNSQKAKSSQTVANEKK
jgi:hypothetical protein